VVTAWQFGSWFALPILTILVLLREFYSQLLAMLVVATLQIPVRNLVLDLVKALL
jgi:hypothetical protein